MNTPSPSEQRIGWRSRVARLVVVLGCAVLAVGWIYVLFVADEEPVYQIEDPTWRPRALEICSDVDAALTALTVTEGGFITAPTPEQLRERADLVDESTDILDQMVADLVGIPVDNEDDRLRLATFEEHYRMVIADRRRYSASLRAGDDVDYTETVAGGGPVSNVVFDFTAGVKGNDIPLCSPPGDLALTIDP